MQAGPNRSAEASMRRWVLVLLGALLAIAGVIWTLQGLNLLGQSGGMNGQRIWALIGCQRRPNLDPLSPVEN